MTINPINKPINQKENPTYNYRFVENLFLPLLRVELIKNHLNLDDYFFMYRKDNIYP